MVMKRISLILISLALFTACNKDQVVPTTVSIFSPDIDTFTVVDNGITYFDTSLYVTLDELMTGDFITIRTVASTQFPIAFNVYNVTGPAGNTGLYQLYPQDTIATSNEFVEVYNGGMGYTIDSAAINITTVSQSLITGTYQLWLGNALGHKTVSGIIKCHNPQIEL